MQGFEIQTKPYQSSTQTKRLLVYPGFLTLNFTSDLRVKVLRGVATLGSMFFSLQYMIE